MYIYFYFLIGFCSLLICLSYFFFLKLMKLGMLFRFWVCKLDKKYCCFFLSAAWLFHLTPSNSFPDVEQLLLCFFFFYFTSSISHLFSSMRMHYLCNLLWYENCSTHLIFFSNFSVFVQLLLYHLRCRKQDSVSLQYKEALCISITPAHHIFYLSLLFNHTWVLSSFSVVMATVVPRYIFIA